MWVGAAPGSIDPMDPALAASLALLALIDSTSFGTLLIPIWFLIAPGRVRIGRLLLYLGTILVCYFGLGLVLLTAGRAVIDRIGGWLDTPAVAWAQLVFGVALVVISFRIDTPRSRERGKGRLTRWRDRAMGTGADAGSTNLLPLMGLALGAVAVEAGSMLPYLGAIGLLSSSGMTFPATVLVLLGYCGVMIAPAVALTTLRTVARSAVEPALERISGWLTKHAGGATAWIVGIVGFLIARDAFVRIGGADGINQLGQFVERATGG